MNKLVKGLRFLSKDISKIVLREIDFYRIKPTTSLLFLTYRCNSHCKTCSFWKRPQKEEKEKEIGFERWKVIIDKLFSTGIKVTELFGGNVLLRKDLLISILEYMKKKNFIVHLPINQIGLDDEIAFAMSQYADFVYISVDGIGEYQDTIRGQKGAAQRAKTSIEKLLYLRQSRKVPRLICNTTVSKYNVAILDRLSEYASTRGFDELHFEYAGEFSIEDIDNSSINNIKPNPYFVKQDESILLNDINAKNLKEKLRSIRNRHRFENIKFITKNIDALSLNNLVDGTIPHKKCYVLRNEITIDPSGNIVACPFFNNYIIGSLLEHTFTDLWHSERYQEFRKSQQKQNVAVCNHCILGVQRNPSLLSLLKRTFSYRLQNVKLKYEFR